MEETFLDPTAFERLRKLGGDKLVLKMIDASESNMAARLAEAVAGWGEKDLGIVEKAAHSIKSSAGNIGAGILMIKAADLEILAERKKEDGVEGLLGEIAEIFDRVKSELSLIKGEQG